MTGGKLESSFSMNERRLSIIVFTLFSSWMLAFPFEGQILYAIASKFNLDSYRMVFGAVAAMAAGLLFWGFVIKTKKAARFLMLCSTILCLISSAIFFKPSFHLWPAALIAGSFLISASVAGWGYYFKSSTPKNERIKTAAAVMIYTNILMTLLNMTAIYLSPYLGLGLAMLLLGGAFLFALLLPVDGTAVSPHLPDKGKSNIAKPLALLCLFILVITIDSGLMYQVLNPAFSHLKWLTGWYWAVPYIIGLYMMMSFSRKISRSYILYVAIAMIGLSFIAFMILDRSALSYIVVNTLMLGACGVCDLFLLSILGEMLDLSANPAKIFGIGLSANVVGVLIGGLIGKFFTFSGAPTQNTVAIALAVVCVTLVILPLLFRQLSVLLDEQALYTALSVMPPDRQDKLSAYLAQFGILSAREREVAALLLQGKTYKKIASELSISENTVKTHVKNIYSKYNIQSRGELIDLVFKEEGPVRQ